jgi:hypothetical protein
LIKLFKYIFSIFFILTINAQQTSTISGFVRDNASGEPLSYVNIFVVIEGSYKGSATNQDGYYVISDLVPGEYIVNASIIGYKMISNNVTLLREGSKYNNFLLGSETTAGYSVGIQGALGVFGSIASTMTTVLIK